MQSVFDELVALIDPGVEPYKPKKGQTNVVMAVGLQVRSSKHSLRPVLKLLAIRAMAKPRRAQSSRCITKKGGSNPPSSVRIPSAPAHSIRHANRPPKLRSRTLGRTLRQTQSPSPCKACRSSERRGSRSLLLIHQEDIGKRRSFSRRWCSFKRQ